MILDAKNPAWRLPKPVKVTYHFLIAAMLLLLTPNLALSQNRSGDAKPGLIQVHFNGGGFSRPKDASIIPQIYFDTGTEHGMYCRFLLGSMRIPTSKEITFSAEADDGLMLSIGDRKIIDDGGSWGAGEREGTLTAREGDRLPLDVEFYQHSGAAHLRLFWAWEGRPRELVPADALFHSAADLERAGEMVNGDLVPRMPDLKPGVRVGPIYEPDGPHSGRLPADAGPIALDPGPQLFLDEYLIESATNVARKPILLQRDPEIPNPMITGAKDNGDRNFQPLLSCLRDPQTGRFRFWYNIGIDSGTSGLGYLESADGIHWERPHRQLPKPNNINFGVGVIDEGLDSKPAGERYKMAFFGKAGIAEIWASPDGLDWTYYSHGPVPTNDIINLARDTARNRYIITHVAPTVPMDGYKGGTQNAPEGYRRIVGQSVSPDLKQWTTPRRIIMPGEKDEGITEYYGVGGLRNRGELIVGMLKVLRDDLPADPGGEVHGIAYTVVAWTRDGENWLREREPLIDRDHTPGSWDHAHAWADVQLPVDDEVYIYYGGYKGGHKVNRFEERQVGLIKMLRDRYIAREAGAKPGLLRTPPVIIKGTQMTVNVEPTAADGEVRVQAVDETGKPLSGFAFADCAPVTADQVAALVKWSGKLADLNGKPVRLEFSLKNARLYAFDVE